MLLALCLAIAAEVPGPWSTGHYVDLAVSGADVHAVWLEGDVLWYAKGSGPRERVASGVEAGDGGGVRPDILVIAGAPVVVYSTADKLVRSERSAKGWTATTVSPAGVKGPFQSAAAVGASGKVVAAGLAWDGKRSTVFVDGKTVFEGGTDGVCMCCRPSLLARSTGFTLAFRDADGNRRDIRTLTSADGISWTDAGEVTHGGWSPGGCPTDGPVLSGSSLLVSDGRTGKRVVYEVDAFGEHAVPSKNPAAEQMQPRAVADGSLTVWVEAVPGTSALVVRDGPGAPVELTSTNGRLEPGDPVVVGSEVWIPWEGSAAHVERWVSVAPPM